MQLTFHLMHEPFQPKGHVIVTATGWDDINNKWENIKLLAQHDDLHWCDVVVGGPEAEDGWNMWRTEEGWCATSNVPFANDLPPLAGVTHPSPAQEVFYHEATK